MPNVENLKALAHGLRTVVKPERFDLEYYVSGNPEELTDDACGSAGCALGWCPVIFPGQWWWSSGINLPAIIDERSPSSSARKFFDINHDAFGYLFLSDYYPPAEWRNPIAVANRIDALIEGGEAWEAVMREADECEQINADDGYDDSDEDSWDEEDEDE